jgi:hypothetical protein
MVHPTPRRFHLVAASVGLIAAIVATWPVAAHLRDHIIDGARLIDPKNPDSFAAGNIGADVLTTVWIVGWVLHALVTQPLHLFEANIFYPAPMSLARCEHMVATALLGIPGMLLDGPVLAHQTALLLCLALTVWSTAYLVTRWSGSLAGGLAAGVLFVLCPTYRGKVVLLKLLGAAYFPLILLGLERFAASGTLRWLAVAGAALVLEMLSGVYLGYFALVLWAVAGAIALIGGRRTDRPLRRLIHDGARLAMVSAAAALVVLPFIVPYLRLEDTAELPANSDNVLIMTAAVGSLRDYVIGPTWDGLVWPGSRPPITPSLQLLAVLGIGALLWQGREGVIRAAMLVGVGLVCALLSMGANRGSFGLYGLLAMVVPGFHTLRGPHRWAVMPHLMAAMLGGVGVAALVRGMPRVGSVLAATLVSLALLKSWPVPLPLRAMPVGAVLPEAYRYLARCGAGDPLLELPATHPNMLDNFRDGERDFFSTFHWLPLLNGRSGYQPPLFRETMQLAWDVPEPQPVATLRRLTGLRWVLVHCDAPRPRTPGVDRLCGPEGWATVPRRDFGTMRLYDLGPVPALPREWPRRWAVRGDCS